MFEEATKPFKIKTNNPISLFLYRKREKAFAKFLKQWLLKDKPFDDAQIAIHLSSLLTHSLIEISRRDTSLYITLDAEQQASILAQFLSGKITQQEIKKYYKRFFYANATSYSDSEQS